MDSVVARLFVRTSIDSLHRTSGHIESCLRRLSDDQIWSRGAEHENSVGNLVLHLCGNMRQWICSGVGGQQDVRDRDLEFATRGGIGSADLSTRLRQTLLDAAEALEQMPVAKLTEQITIQNRTQSGLEAIYHVTTHFHQHAGQIIFATKIFSGEDLGLQRPAPVSTR